MPRSVYAEILRVLREQQLIVVRVIRILQAFAHLGNAEALHATVRETDVRLLTVLRVIHPSSSRRGCVRASFGSGTALGYVTGRGRGRGRRSIINRSGDRVVAGCPVTHRMIARQEQLRLRFIRIQPGEIAEVEVVCKRY